MNKKFTLTLLGLLLFALFSYAQKSVRGKVTDASDGMGIPGVSVSVKGQTGNTVATNNDGTFTINVPSNNSVLVFSYIGYATKEVTVGNQVTINVGLSSSNQQLDEVMVVAYGTAKRSTFTGSASVVKADDIKEMPTTSFQNALAGRMPGVQVTNSSGQAGATPSIRIRGTGSINASNEPLYVIDGVPVISGGSGQLSDYTYSSNNIMNTINPADIESITILKDAAASSLYGSRAANGVVIINTKRGKTGKPKIEFRTSLGLTPSWATDNYEAASPQEQINMLYSILYDSRISAGRTPQQANEQTLMRLNSRNWTPGSSYGTATTAYGFGMHGYEFSTQGTGMYENVIIKGKTDGVENRDGKYYDWENALFRTAKYQTNDLAVSGGDDNTKYYSSFSYTKDQGRVRVNDFDRFSGRINLSQKIGKIIEVGSNVNFARSVQSGYNDTRNTSSNSYMQTRNLLWPFYWPTDYKTGQPFTARYVSLAQNNIYYDKQWDNQSLTKRIIANSYLQANVLPELTLKTVFSYDNSQVSDHLYYSAIHYNGQASNGSVNEMTTNYNKWVSSSTANFNKQFGSHSLGLLVGFEAEKNLTDYQRATGQDLGNSELQSVSTAGTVSSTAYNWGNAIVSGLSRLEYNYNQKYFFSSSFRRDGSSKLGTANRWSNFWSIAGSWILSSEDFVKKLKFVDNLRVRASYGTNGTLPNNNFEWRELTSYSNKYLGQPAGLYASLYNPELTWESSQSTNIALEFGIFKRFTGTVEYFNKDTKSLLLAVPVSMTTGFSENLRNIGEVNNRGMEIELSASIISNDQFKWNAGINASFINSKVTRLYRPEGVAIGNDIIWNDPTGGDARAQFLYTEGRSLLSFYGFEWAGVQPTTGKNVWYVNGSDPSAGDFIYNGRGATLDYNKANRKIIGDGTPDVIGGFNTDFEYRGITLGLVFNYKIGGQIYDGAYKDVADDGYYWERIRAKSTYENMWTPSNTNGSLPKLDGNDLTDPMQYSTRQLHSATFLRLKNVVLAYRLPKNLVSKLGASNARIYFNGTNLLTFSKYKEADPEVGTYSTRGWETPFGKTYTFGLEFSF
ncbi:SusC/RagA family TonB-linked outer membrane protein [Pedobacter chitinilyticus]|uniref:TonB-dependent receptor n=1 Tax=Pedobacter chitinilyticus TaxID=2233776 RepID=A0A443Z195_9SPHI|nr:TonB-dependent receptor [Pedobacter chitinilyticus]RWU10303.1 TonB-dependent receptor [Pedobacter chitinilyticus]